jgi:hypothetical protein
MKFIFFFAALHISGYNSENPVAFKTKEQCQKALGMVPSFVEKFNSKEEDKILSYAAACVEFKPAKAGMQM